MSFKYIVDNKKNIVVLKAVGKVSVMDIIAEIQEAIDTHRGDGISRRLIDMTDSEITYNLEDVQKVLKMVKASATVLGSKRVAIIFKEAPEGFDQEKIRSILNTQALEIGFFTDRTTAVRFLNKSSR